MTASISSLLSPVATFYRTVWRDPAGCLWFRHLPGPVGSRLATLDPGSPITLLVRRAGDLDRVVTTRWVRMKTGRDGRPTQGVRITDGSLFFEAIPRGTELEIAFAETEWGTAATIVAPLQPTPAVSTTTIPTARGPLFQAYLIADYSGAADLAVQRRSIRVAVGEHGRIEILPGPFTRTSLVRELVARLVDFTRRDVRALVGIDHQYGIPAAMAEEIGLNGISWRDALTQLYSGNYGVAGGPRWDHPRRFAAAFNDFLKEQGRPDYFWSATKRELYGLRHGSNPRTATGNDGVFRLTERCRGVVGAAIPKPLARGRQWLCGQSELLRHEAPARGSSGMRAPKSTCRRLADGWARYSIHCLRW